MKSILGVLLLAGLFTAAPSVWADSISVNQAESAGFWNGTEHFDLGLEMRNNSGFDGAFTDEDAEINCFATDQFIDFPQSHSSKKHRLFFGSKWDPDHRWDSGDMGDIYWVGWGDHDGGRGNHWDPTVPIPEPESLWLFLAGMAVVGLSSLLRRAMPKDSKLDLGF